jgi:hypothetical protein
VFLQILTVPIAKAVVLSLSFADPRGDWSESTLIVAVSDGNGSDFPDRFRVQFQPGTELLQPVSTQNPLLNSQHFFLQLSI